MNLVCSIKLEGAPSLAGIDRSRVEAMELRLKQVRVWLNPGPPGFQPVSTLQAIKLCRFNFGVLGACAELLGW